MPVKERSDNCWYWLKTQMCWFFLIRRYSKLPCLSFFVQASGEHVSNRSNYNSLRELKSVALPGVHCLTGKYFEAASDEQRVAFTYLKVPVLRNLDGLCLQQNKYSKNGSHPQETLIPAVNRANFQSLIWAEDDKPNPIIPSPQGYGWSTEVGQLVRVNCEISCAPESLLELVECIKSRCRPPCRCLSNNIPCTEMCAEVMKITVNK